MKQSQQKTASFSWLVGLRWSFAGAGALDFPMLARAMLLAAAVCFVVSLVCAGACIRSSKAARWYLLLVLVMIMIALLFGRENIN